MTMSVRDNADTGLLARVSRLLGHEWSMALSALILGLIVVMTILGPLITPHSPNATDFSAVYSGPSAEHLLGTDGLGRDIFSRIVSGARISLLAPLIVVFVSVTAGTLIALASVWYGGAIDRAVGRALDVAFSFPALLLAILSVALFGRDILAPMVALTIGFTPYVARLVRAPALRLRSAPFIAACEVQGIPVLQIWLRHIVPGLFSSIAGIATILFGQAMIDLAALSYLGLGVQPPTADWGAMIAGGQQDILSGYPQESLSAGIVLVVVVVCVNIIGQRLGDHRGEGQVQ